METRNLSIGGGTLNLGKPTIPLGVNPHSDIELVPDREVVNGPYHWAIDWDRVVSFDDMKRVLKAIDPKFTIFANIGSIRDLVRKEPYRFLDGQ